VPIGHFPLLGSLAEVVVASVALLLGIATIYDRTGRSASIASGAASAAALVGGMAILASTSYVVAALSPFPMMDAMLASADRFLGFDWNAWTAWGRAHPVIWNAQAAAYDAMHPELGIVVLYLGLRQRAKRLIVSLFVGGIITIAVSWFVPAVGHLPNASHVPVLLALRAGHLLDVAPQGLISFPSFHTTVALLLTAGLSGERWLFPIACIVNGTMVISTISMGGHYLMDVLAGIIIAGVAIHLASRWFSSASGIAVPETAPVAASRSAIH
jgi:membrane-associated phospholipid phosphatase